VNIYDQLLGYMYFSVKIVAENLERIWESSKAKSTRIIGDETWVD
jgi:hypothetical protein